MLRREPVLNANRRELGLISYALQQAILVALDDYASGAKATYQIVGDDEADLKHGLISISSPIARALIGKEAGEVAEVQAPGGLRHWEIVDVRYV